MILLHECFKYRFGFTPDAFCSDRGECVCGECQCSQPMENEVTYNVCHIHDINVVIIESVITIIMFS